MQYEIVAEAYRDLEHATGRLALIDRLAALLAPGRRRELVEHLWIHRRPVGDDLRRSHFGRADGLFEETPSRRGVPPPRDEHVYDLPELVKSPGTRTAIGRRP